MEVFEAIKRRRSIRRFKEEPFPEDLLKKLLDAARMAPSAGNVQPWKFFVVRNKDIQAKLADAALGQTWMLSAPVMIVVCADLDRAKASYGRRGSELYALQDTAAAIQNILLGATGAGLASCWVGAFREEMAANILGIDYDVLRPVAIIPLGYPAESSRVPPKRGLDEITQYID